MRFGNPSTASSEYFCWIPFDIIHATSSLMNSKDKKRGHLSPRITERSNPQQDS